MSQVTDMENLFKNQADFNEDLSKWKVGNVTTLKFTFYGATSFNCDLSGWDVSNVTTMMSTFREATSFNQKLSGAWSTSTADQTLMFSGCPGSILKVLETTTHALTCIHTHMHACA